MITGNGNLGQTFDGRFRCRGAGSVRVLAAAQADYLAAAVDGIPGSSPVLLIGAGSCREDQCQGGACAIACDAPWARPLVTFARRENARREEDGPASFSRSRSCSSA